uniref:Uncharacterized protein n=1 Tax=Arundo donax TaxID=35708 RepID=A0A0A9DLN7_ARUDO
MREGGWQLLRQFDGSPAALSCDGQGLRLHDSYLVFIVSSFWQQPC